MEAPSSCKVYTPEDLAFAMACALGHCEGDTWLDPCCGDGAFCRAVSRLGPGIDMTAVDLDRNAVKRVKASKVIQGVDFIRWSMETDKRFAKIIANPPYVRIRFLPPTLRASALACRGLTSRRTSANANYWYFFLLQCIRLLKRGGSLSAVLPAAWDYANYAREIRRQVGALFREVEVHRCRQPLFDDVHDGSVVVVARGYSETPRLERRAEHASRGEVIAGLLGSRQTVASSVRIRVGEDPVCSVRRFGDLFDLRIGAVTGDSKYFLMCESRRIELGLPRRCLIPVVSRAAHLMTPELGREQWRRLLEADERIWLFRPQEGSGGGGAIRRYLLRSASNGGCNKHAHKIRHRKPWYQTPMPERVDGFVSGMAALGPVLTWKGMRRLSASNTLYVVRCRSREVFANRFAWSLSMLCSRVRAQLALRSRLYADGLAKLEPNDFVEVLVPTPPSAAGAKDVYRSAIALLRGGNELAAVQVADEWLGTTRTRTRRMIRESECASHDAAA